MADKERATLEEVDINELQFTDEDEFPEGFDPSEDAFEQSPPVADGDYRVKITLQEEEAYQGWKSESGKQEIKANLVAEIVQVIRVPDAYKEDKVEGAKMFGSVSTTIPRGKSTCTMAGLLRELKQDKKYTKLIGDIPTSKQQLVSLFDKVMKAEPIITIHSQWEAWEEQKEGNFKCVKRGMENFPKDKVPGRFVPVIKGKGGEVTAKPKIRRWMGVETEKAMAAARANKGPVAAGASKPPQHKPKPPAAPPDEPEIIEGEDENV